MKKIVLIVISSVGALAISLSGGVNKIFGSVWDTLDKGTNQILSVCYSPSNVSSSIDACSLLNKLGNLEFNACSIAPPIPQFKKKDRDISLSGLKSLCDSQVKEFSNVASTSASNIAENLIDENGLSDKTTLPNGMKVKDYLKRWDVRNIFKNNSNKGAVKTYLMNDRQSSLRILMDYDKHAKDGRGLDEISVENIKVSKDLETYRKDRQELAESFYNNRKETSANSISSSVSLAISGKKGSEAQSSARDFLTAKKEQIETAKANEIGQALRIYSNQNDSIAIPTQETVDFLRADLKPQAIEKIRRQQLEEAQIIADVNEKWSKREAIVELIVDKEVIMNEKFDEEAARAEIENVIASANSNDGGFNSNAGAKK